MPSHMFIILLIGLSFLGVADTVRATSGRSAAAGSESGSTLPNLNIESACRDVAENELNRTSDYPGCMSKERTARDELQKEWASYPPDMHSQCVHLVTPPALTSYVTLQQCLRLGRDARNLTKSDGATEIGKNDAPVTQVTAAFAAQSAVRCANSKISLLHPVRLLEGWGEVGAVSQTAEVCSGNRGEVPQNAPNTTSSSR